MVDVEKYNVYDYSIRFYNFEVQNESIQSIETYSHFFDTLTNPSTAEKYKVA